MSRYYTNFEDSLIGTDPASNWTAQWDAATTPANHDLVPRYGTPLVKRREARLYAANSTRAAFSMNAVDSDANRANVEVLTLVKRASSPDTGAQNLEIWLRAAGSTASFSGYRALIGWPDSAAPNQVNITRFNAAAGTALVTAGAITLSTSKAYWFRFRVNGSSPCAYSLSVWPEDQTEAQATVFSGSDVAGGSALGVGWVGVNVFGSVACAAAVNFLSVGTNGDTAWKPRTNAEYNAWLDDQTQERLVIAEMSATGYVGGGPPHTATRNLYVGNGGFTSQAWDSPASRHYDAWIAQIPTFRRQMGLALNGRANVGFGSLVLSNPASTSAGTGARENFLRMKWKRSSVKMYLGGPTWPKHDFRLQLYGRLGLPTAPSDDKIEFPILDISDVLTGPLQPNRYSSTAAKPNAVKPIIVGQPQWMELVPTTVGSLEFQLHDGTIADEGVIYDDGVALTSGGLVTAVDYVTDTITVPNHGAAVDSTVQFGPFPATAPPAPLVPLTKYYVIAAGLTTNDFRLSATRGGAAINLTAGGVGSSAGVQNWWADLTTGKVTLVRNPAGRVLSRLPMRAAASDEVYPARLIEHIVFTRFGLSADFKDQAAFDAAAVLTWGGFFQTSAAVFYDEVTALQALDRLANAHNFWYGFTPDGLLQIGRLDLPTSTAVLTLTQSDVKGLRLESTLLPINRASLTLRQQPRFVLNGQLAIAPATTKHAELFSMWTTEVGSAWSTVSTPLDEYPNAGDVKDQPPFELYFLGTSTLERDRIETFYKKTLGTFTFRTRFSALRPELTIGSTISLSHPRMGWKTYDGSDPASPENFSGIDARLATVIGIEVNLASKDPFPVRLTVFRQLPGYYPSADLN